jgi:hypothetical protein
VSKFVYVFHEGYPPRAIAEIDLPFTAEEVRDLIRNPGEVMRNGYRGHERARGNAERYTFEVVPFDEAQSNPGTKTHDVTLSAVATGPKSCRVTADITFWDGRSREWRPAWYVKHRARPIVALWHAKIRVAVAEQRTLALG